MKPNFNQNIIAIVWDFDKTLIPTYMQEPLFEEYNIDPDRFWTEVGELPALYAEQGITISPDTVYLNHLLSYVEEGICTGLTNAKLRELGAKLKFFAGLPEFFAEAQELVRDNLDYKKFDLKLEHYIVSTGLTEMIRGSKIAPYVNGIWGCEFVEKPYISADSGLVVKEGSGDISSIAYAIDNTTKTRALFEINKGVNVHPEDISVNQAMAEEDRRVPFENIIYVADGPSDIPAFSVVKKQGGKTFAVYNKDNPQSFRQAKQLLEHDRVDMFGEADYREATTTYLWLLEQITTIADSIVSTRKSKLRKARGSVPSHLNN